MDDDRKPLTMPQDEFELARKVATAAGLVRDRATRETIAEAFARSPHDSVLAYAESERERANAAEAKLSVIATWARRGALLDPDAILAVVAAETPVGLAALAGGEIAPLSATCTGCGQQYADEESGAYLFSSREGLERHLRDDGWAADPVLCPACHPEEA